MISRKSEFSLLILILVLSLFLRLFALDVFLSGDETKWICRGINFHSALARGDLESTYQSEHPGVVTMWIVALTVPLSETGEWADRCAQDQATKLTGIEDHATLALLLSLIFRARRPLTLVTWLGVIGIWWLCRRLYDEKTALLAAVFIALDPFYLALSRVLHLDALLTTFMTLSILSLLVYLRGGHALRYLLLSAVAAGLAIANKSPGLFLIPWTGLLLLIFAGAKSESDRRQWMWKVLQRAVLWSIVAVATVVLLWPTLWVQPLSALTRVFAKGMNYAQEPHGESNFFWGAIRPDPGPAFYPVAWAFRTTPWVLIGLPLALLGSRGREQRRSLLVLGGFALCYAAFMTVGAKKFDRYLLPVFPVVDLLAATGWRELLRRCSRIWQARWTFPALASLVLLLTQFALLWRTRPYYGSYYNPLLGGATIAQKVLLVGWGEGMERAAQYLNQKPSAEQFHVNTDHISQFAPFFRGHTSGLSELDLAESDYYVFYMNSIQRFREPEVLSRFYGQVEPEKVISAHSIDYVWIYSNTLYRPALDYIEARADPLREVLLLDVHSALTRHYGGPLPLVVIHGSMREDDIISQLGQAAEGRSGLWYLTFLDKPSDARGLVPRHLRAQADLTERAYFEGMVLERYELHPGAQFTMPTPTVRCDIRLGDRIRLMGYDLPELELKRDRPLRVTLYWQASAPLDTSYTVFTHLLGPDGQLWGQFDSIPQGGHRPTSIWLPEETIVDRYEVPLHPGAPAGDYTLALGLYNFETMERLPAADAAGRWLPENRILIEGLELSTLRLR